jgi:hypothetical protein
MAECNVCGPHDHRNCSLCSLTRHPARAKQGAELRRVWANPPRQRDRRSRTGETA